MNPRDLRRKGLTHKGRICADRPQLRLRSGDADFGFQLGQLITLEGRFSSSCLVSSATTSNVVGCTHDEQHRWSEGRGRRSGPDPGWIRSFSHIYMRQ